MKHIIITISFLTAHLAFGQSKDYPFKVVPFTDVKLTDNFWLPRIKVNHTVTIPASFERCEKTGRVSNFVMAAEKKGNFVQSIRLMILIFIKRLKAHLIR